MKMVQQDTVREPDEIRYSVRVLLLNLDSLCN